MHRVDMGERNYAIERPWMGMCVGLLLWSWRRAAAGRCRTSNLLGEFPACGQRSFTAAVHLQGMHCGLQQARILVDPGESEGRKE